MMAEQPDDNEGQVPPRWWQPLIWAAAALVLAVWLLLVAASRLI